MDCVISAWISSSPPPNNAINRTTSTVILTGDLLWTRSTFPCKTGRCWCTHLLSFSLTEGLTVGLPARARAAKAWFFFLISNAVGYSPQSVYNQKCCWSRHTMMIAGDKLVDRTRSHSASLDSRGAPRVATCHDPDLLVRVNGRLFRHRHGKVKSLGKEGLEGCSPIPPIPISESL